MHAYEYETFFNHYTTYKKQQNEQKKRGLNDFNLLTTVLSYDDEVRLHSRLIGNLLNPFGKHYRDNQFLDIFLDIIGLSQWGMDTEQADVFIEYKDIDLYITDGEKHIIIENKIWADDQPCQLTKYINIIMEENRDILIFKDNTIDKIDDNQLRVFYLTPRKKDKPDEHEVDEDGYIYFSGTKEKLIYCSKRDRTKKYLKNGLKNYKAKYEKLSYKKHIMQWLELSKLSVNHIANLSYSINEYQDVVRKVMKIYKGNVMTLKQYAEENHISIALMSKIQKEIVKLQGDVLYDFFKNISIKDYPIVNQEVKDNNQGKKADLVYSKKKCDDWFCPKCQRKKKDFGTFLKINDEYLLFIFLGTKYMHIGIVRHANYSLQDMSEAFMSTSMGHELSLYHFEYRPLNFLKWISSRFELLDNFDKLDNILHEKCDQIVKAIQNRSDKNKDIF